MAKIFASYAEIAEDDSGVSGRTQSDLAERQREQISARQQPIKFGSEDHIGRGPFDGTPVNYNGLHLPPRPRSTAKSNLWVPPLQFAVSEWP